MWIAAGAALVAALATLPVTTDSAARPAHAGPVAVLETTQGRIVIELLPASAPKTVANFEKLVRRHFYDGTCFHRVIPGFMIQGGDPNSRDANPFNDGQGGPGYTVPAEIHLQHERGSVATARLPDAINPTKASSGSQFFIDLAPQPSLDKGGYTVFGRVIAGMDAVDRIAALASHPDIARVNNSANPGKLAEIKRAWLEPAAGARAKPADSTRAAPADSATR